MLKASPLQSRIFSSCSPRRSRLKVAPAIRNVNQVASSPEKVPIDTASRTSNAKTNSLRMIGAVCCVVSGLFLAGAISPDSALAAAAASAPPAAEGGLKYFISFFLHLDKHLAGLIAQHGTAVYGILWAIVFCETGLIVTPFLPGDSLLFAAGAFASMGSLSLTTLFAVFITAAILGDAVNYAVGKWLGSRVKTSGLVSPGHIRKTEKFYEKYGGKTVVMARFLPILRTFAPFVAGVGSMDYGKFFTYNVVGALVWVLLFVYAGYFFGSLPFVQHNFTLVVLGIIVLSVAPVVIEIARGGLRVDDEDEEEAGGEGKGKGQGTKPQAA